MSQWLPPRHTGEDSKADSREGKRAATVAGCLLSVLVLLAANVVLMVVYGGLSTDLQERALVILGSSINGLKVAFVLAFLYVYLPFKLMPLPPGEAAVDRLFAAFTVMTAMVIVAVHILSLLKLYDTISGLLALVVTCFMVARVMPGATAASAGDAVVFDTGGEARVFRHTIGQVLDSLDTVQGFWGSLVYPLVRSTWNLIARWSRRLLRLGSTPDLLLLLLAIAPPAYVRFHHAVTRACYSCTDPYVHLAWMKHLSLGTIYSDGIYPHGMHALLSVLDRVAFFDPYWIIRFAGPVIGMALVLSVYCVVVRVTGDMPAGAVAAFVYGIEAGLPAGAWRQTATMPQEFAALYLLPGSLFLWEYLEGRRRRLHLYGVTYFVTLMTHTFVSFYFVIATSCMLVACALAKRLRVTQVVLLLGTGLAATAVGTLPYTVGMAAGKPLHSVEWGLSTQILSPQAPTARVGALLLGETPSVLLGIILSAIALAATALLRSVGKDVSPQRWFISGLGLTALALYFTSRARLLGLPQLVDPARTQMFFSFVSVTVIGCVLAGTRHMSSKPVRVTVAACVIITLLFVFRPVPYEGDACEYSSAAENYLSIDREFAPLSWTLVGPVEQYQQVLGRGWHYELWRFASTFDPRDVAREEFDFPIPTTHVFVMVEKVPLGATSPVDPEVGLEPPPPPMAGQGATDHYYRNVRNRTIVESRAMAICEAYMRNHERASVYYEDEVLRVYRFDHDVKRESQGR